MTVYRVALLLVVLAVLVGCAGETDPATNVGPNGATLNGKGDCDASDGRVEWWYELAQGAGAFSRVGPRNVAEAGCETNGKVALPPLAVTGLTPSTQYRFRVAMDTDDADTDANAWADANGNTNGTSYDTFTTTGSTPPPPSAIPPVSKRIFFPFDSNYSPGQLGLSGSVWTNTFQGGYLRMQQRSPVTGSAQFDRAQVSGGVGWGKGTNAWYGGRFRLEGPASNLRFTTFVAGDDYPNARLGVVIENAEGVLITTRYGGTQRVLGRFPLPLGTDFKLDIHQVLHEGTGALNEIYVNDQRVVNTTTPNLLDANQRVNNMRYGYVSQSGNSTAGAMRLYEAYLTEAPP